LLRGATIAHHRTQYRRQIEKTGSGKKSATDLFTANNAISHNPINKVARIPVITTDEDEPHRFEINEKPMINGIRNTI
jgi:hypothetical protein